MGNISISELKEKTIDELTDVAKELNVIGVGGNGGKGKYEIALRLVEKGVIDPTRLITHRFPFTQALEAFSVARDKSNNAIKVVVSNH